MPEDSILARVAPIMRLGEASFTSRKGEIRGNGVRPFGATIPIALPGLRLADARLF
jgi:hypothetical protein